VIDVPRARFEELVADALDSIPEDLGRRMDNVWVVVEERPHGDLAGEGLLGLYEGVPLTEREAYGGMVLPDRITVYRRPTCEMCETEPEVVETVRDTVIHEVAHHFGIDDDRLEELGWA
jgi:predicted Zn-dependent protease with MMP-like domain